MGQQSQTLTAARTVDLGHQEVQRLIEELDNVYHMSRTEWLQASPIANFLCTQLGYEDIPELEDALQGTFSEFLTVLPHVETKLTPPANDVSTSSEDQLYFRFKPEPDQSEWISTKMVYQVTGRAQLWNVLLKSPHARIEIPAIGLEVCADGKRKIDTIWNYLSAAALDLGMHVQSQRGLSDSDTDKTARVIEQLAELRDVDYPWVMEVVDPSGISSFTDMSCVQVTQAYVDQGSHVDKD